MGSRELDEPRQRANSVPENIIRKVTIQQMVVQQASTSVAFTEYAGNPRQFPRVEHHDPSGRGHRGKHPVKPTRGVVARNVKAFESRKTGEGSSLETTRRAEERELWEKAVKELELVIAEKDTAIEKLSKVNRKLSEDVQWYERSLQDCNDNMRTVEERLKQATEDNKDKEWYERVIREREEKIHELEGKLNDMARPSKTRDRQSLELSQGAKSVLKTLELKKEKIELEKKIEELEKQLRKRSMRQINTQQESRRINPVKVISGLKSEYKFPITSHQQEFPDTDHRKRFPEIDHRQEFQDAKSEVKIPIPDFPSEGHQKKRKEHEKAFQEMTSNIKRFQVTMERQLHEKLQMVTELQTRLSHCTLRCRHLSEKFGITSAYTVVPCVKETVSAQSSLQVASQQKLDQWQTDQDFIPGVLQRKNEEPGISNQDDRTTENFTTRAPSLGNVSPGDVTLGHMTPDIVNLGDITQEIVKPGDIIPDIVNQGNANQGDVNPRLVNARDAQTEILNPGFSSPGDSDQDDSTREELVLMPHEKQLNILQEALLKERKINDEIIERFLELEESNSDKQATIESLRAKADVNDEFRAQNERLIREISEIKKSYLSGSRVSLDQLGDTVDGTVGHHDVDGCMMVNRDALRIYQEQVRTLRLALESREKEIDELREKTEEDEELIEELRANCQREEKWNREMQRKYEWELSTSASKDDRIEEYHECLWAREKTMRQLREQLEFEDKRCEELLEKLVASQKEAQEFQQIAQNFKKRLENKEKRITEFCEQNDRDAVAIGNLSSENNRLRLEVESLKKVKRDLEEEIENLNEFLEKAEENRERIYTKQKKDENKLVIQLEEEEYASKGKDEVIEKLREDVELLSADVKEIELQKEGQKETLEAELKRAKETVHLRENELGDASEKYTELQEVCESLKEKISRKDDQIQERETDIAKQRELIEAKEKEIGELREICGDTSMRLNDKPALAYTEQEMDEINEFLEQEKEISETYRAQITFLENEVDISKKSFQEIQCQLEAENKAREKDLDAVREEVHARNTLIEKTREELHARNILLERTREELHTRNISLENTREELHAMSIEQLKQKGTLVSREKELEECKESLRVLQADFQKLDEEKRVLEILVQGNEKRLSSAMEESQKLTKTNENLKEETCRMNEKVKRDEGEINLLKQEVELLKGRCFTSDEALRQASVNNINLKYALQTYVSQSQDRLMILRNHEQEVEILGKHIEEMNILVNGFRSALEHAVRKNAEENLAEKTENNGSVVGRSSSSAVKITSMVSGSSQDKPGRSVSNEDLNVSDTHLNSLDTTDGENEPNRPQCAIPDAGSYSHSNDITNSDVDRDVDNDVIGDTNSDVTLRDTRNINAEATSNDLPSTSYLDRLHHVSSTFEFSGKLRWLLVLGLLFFVFLFGCVSNAVVSRKYLFAIVNSVISLTMFVLWREEVRKNKYLSRSSTLGLREKANLRENGHLPKIGNEFLQDEFSKCKYCGNTTGTVEGELLHFRKIKSSFQELHEKFLEAVENSTKDTIPIQELYNDYEKLKDEVDAMRKDRLSNDAESNSSLVLEEEDDSKKVTFTPKKWNKIAQIVGRVLIVVLICETLYTRGTSFSQFVRPLAALLASVLVSYLFEIMWIDPTKIGTQAGQDPREFVREIEELNEIIDKEHELVATQREAIIALEKRLQREFQRRIKQRNVFLKKVKYKGKLEDLRELLEENRDNGDTTGHDKVNKSDTDRTVKSDKMDILKDILGRTEQQSIGFDFTFSPMLFFLGIPLTGIMLCCHHILLAVLMIVTQVLVFLKQSRYIGAANLPGVSQKEIKPTVIDTAVVLYACLLGVCLQCSQGIVVLITCCVVQLSVHWWTCYRLAKREDTLGEISRNCLQNDEVKTTEV